MKVGIYDPFWGDLICGAHLYVGKMGKALASHGHDVTVVYHRERIPRARRSPRPTASISRASTSGMSRPTSRTPGSGPAARRLFLARGADGTEISQPYDVFIYSTSGEVPPISRAAGHPGGLLPVRQL